MGGIWKQLTALLLVDAVAQRRVEKIVSGRFLKTYSNHPV